MEKLVVDTTYTRPNDTRNNGGDPPIVEQIMQHIEALREENKNMWKQAKEERSRR